MKRTGTTTAGSVAARIRRGSRRRFYRVSDFDGPRTAVERALERLEDAGELVRVRNGLYFRGVETPLGMAPPNPREVLGELAKGHAIGPAGLSAANRLGLTSQVPRVPSYAVSGWEGRPLERVRTVRRGGMRGKARDAARLNETEIAILEVLDSWEDVVELDASSALERLVAVLRDAEVRPRKLVEAARSEPARVRVRLRYLLERAAVRTDEASLPPASKASIGREALEPLMAAA